MTDVTRRQFVTATLAAGFAMAVMPVTAQTIHTDDSGLIAGEIQIPAVGRQIPGYRTQPASGKLFPVVLVVQEIFGVHEHIKDVCRRFAKQGYLAIAPDLYARQGDVSKLTDMGAIMKIVATVPDAQVLSDLDSAAAWAENSGFGDMSKLGITGFCWGGRITWLYAAHNPSVKAGVAWYGKLMSQPDSMHPRSPLEIAATLKVPVLGLYGGRDQSIPVETVEMMRSGLKAGRTPSEIIVYPDAGHAFHADYRPSYNAKDSADGEKRMYAWFAQYGVAP